MVLLACHSSTPPLFCLIVVCSGFAKKKPCLKECYSILVIYAYCIRALRSQAKLIACVRSLVEVRLVNNFADVSGPSVPRIGSGTKAWSARRQFQPINEP